MLIASAISAFVAKYWALRCQIQTDITQKLKNHMKGLFDEHEKNADEILEIAEKRGIELETEIQFENIINEFKKPFPFWTQWLMSRSVNKIKNNRQAGYHVAIKANCISVSSSIPLFSAISNISSAFFSCSSNSPFM
jgi:hypothetical protein